MSSLFRINEQLENEAIKCFEYGVDSYLFCDCVIFSEDKEEIKVTPYRIENFAILQDFEGSIADDIKLSVELFVEEALLILTNYENLNVSLTFTQVDKNHSDIIDDVDPMHFEFKVIIEGAQDLLKKYNRNELIRDTEEDANDSALNAHMDRRISLMLQLFPKEILELKKKKISGMLKSCSVKDAIYFVANVLGIENVFMKGCDNARIYKNINFPPNASIDNVFDYLQEVVGVYGKGMGFYVMYGTMPMLYVYPKYETNPEITELDKVLHLYNLPENTYLGAHTYHYIDEYDQLHVVCNKSTYTENMSETDVENTGTSIVALRTDTLVDFSRDTSGSSGNFNNNRLMNIGIEKYKSASTENNNNMKYVGVSNNALKFTSDLCANKYVKLSTYWTLALPYHVYAGMPVVFHYEDTNGYKTVSGILSSAQLNITRVGMKYGTTYAGLMQLNIRLMAEEEKEGMTTSDLYQINYDKDVTTNRDANKDLTYGTSYKEFS